MAPTQCIHIVLGIHIGIHIPLFPKCHTAEIHTPMPQALDPNNNTFRVGVLIFPNDLSAFCPTYYPYRFRLNLKEMWFGEEGNESLTGFLANYVSFLTRCPSCVLH